ncbi:hypothetical protein [Phenylobacterium sp.]|uniref:hypothetical protein n=1 Tax=Phenylobacterium sp. TaxID=1871053 RepID=UPI002730F240|nr:hypothetical protein [Phenylobacterium sp.]MDP2214098.1 hypothetical protein [Phenylobacterium sp.]
MKNPYLTDGRLGDVVAAITVLGTYPFYKLSPARWAKRIGGSEQRADHWRRVFLEHPEFFRLASDEKFSLVWRRQFRRNYRVDDVHEVDPDYAIDGTTEDLVSRRPLEPAEVIELVNVAIKLHDRALEQDKTRLWWMPLAAAAVSLVSVLVGAILSALLSQ